MYIYHCPISKNMGKIFNKKLAKHQIESCFFNTENYSVLFLYEHLFYALANCHTPF